MSGATPLLPLYALMAWRAKTLIFYHSATSAMSKRRPSNYTELQLRPFCLGVKFVPHWIKVNLSLNVPNRHGGDVEV
jgi:hypothetical protein